MGKVASRRLVIDACVARSAGGADAVHPTSKACRDFLQAVLEICHHVAWTESLRDEWGAHQSRFARKWRVRMYARKKVERAVGAGRHDALRQLAERACRDQHERELLRKDWRLIESALATDRRIVSRDKNTISLLKRIAREIPDLQGLALVDPEASPASAIQWL